MRNLGQLWNDERELADAMRCVAENVADLMGLEGRGKGRGDCRPDFVVLSNEGEVFQKWIAAEMV